MRQAFDGSLMYDHAGSRDVSTEKRQAKQDLRKRVWDIVRRLPADVYTEQVASRLDEILRRDEMDIDSSEEVRLMLSSEAELFLLQVEEKALKEIPLSSEALEMLRITAQIKQEMQNWISVQRTKISSDQINACERFSGSLPDVEASIEKIDRAHTLLAARRFALGAAALRAGTREYGEARERYVRLGTQKLGFNHPLVSIGDRVVTGVAVDGIGRLAYVLREKAYMLLSNALHRLERIESSEQE